MGFEPVPFERKDNDPQRIAAASQYLPAAGYGREVSCHGLSSASLPVLVMTADPKRAFAILVPT
jgi:hypothetical protein